MAMDIEMHDRDADYDNLNAARHFKIALDFGTTCSSVAFIALDSESETLPERIRANDIPLIDKYPDAPTEGYYSRLAVPTECWYPMSKKLLKVQANMQKDLNISHRLSPEDESPNEHDSSSEAAMADMDDDLEMDCARDFLWGFEVHERLYNIGLKADNGHHLSWFKLMLDKGKDTIVVRQKLANKIKDLKDQRLIKQEWNIIADYLQRLFEHTKDQLETKYGFNETCSVEFILCVPAMWGPPARRDMHTAMAQAIHRSGLQKLADKSIDNLFIVSEPEAAALCVTDIHRLVRYDESFVLIDAGGGTVDAITYRVSRQHPLRLEKEEVPAKAILKGSTYLNQACEDIIRARVHDSDLLPGSVPLDKAIAHAMGLFENLTKRKIDTSDPIKGKARLTIHGLIHNRSKRFSENTIHLSQEEVKSIFNNVIEPIGDLMLEQLDKAKDCNVKNVILIGGFAESVSLQKHLKATLKVYNGQLHRSIGFLTPNAPGTAVAQGAVIRAIRKEEGPLRHIQSSYGFLSSEPYDPENIKEHQGARKTFDKTDGEWYVKDTIRWLIKKGTIVGPSYAEKILSSHTFRASDSSDLICAEKLYVSDEACEDHYPRLHKKNKDAGALEIGKVSFNMTKLKKNGVLQPQQPDPRSGLRAKYYKVEFDLIMRVEGRNLRFEAVYPATENEDWRENHPGTVQTYGQVSIASAFEHGTEYHSVICRDRPPNKSKFRDVVVAESAPFVSKHDLIYGKIANELTNWLAADRKQVEEAPGFRWKQPLSKFIHVAGSSECQNPEQGAFMASRIMATSQHMVPLYMEDCRTVNLLDRRRCCSVTTLFSRNTTYIAVREVAIHVQVTVLSLSELSLIFLHTLPVVRKGLRRKIYRSIVKDGQGFKGLKHVKTWCNRWADTHSLSCASWICEALRITCCLQKQTSRNSKRRNLGAYEFKEAEPEWHHFEV